MLAALFTAVWQVGRARKKDLDGKADKTDLAAFKKEINSKVSRIEFESHVKENRVNNKQTDDRMSKIESEHLTTVREMSRQISVIYDHLINSK